MKKIIMATTLAASVFALAACGGSSNMEDAVVTSDAGEVTVGEFYDVLRMQTNAAQILERMVTFQIFSEKFEVSDEEVEAELERYKEQLGDQFEASLAQFGYADVDALRVDIRGTLAIRKAVEDSITDEQLAEAANTFQVKASHILVEDEETAKDIKSQLDEGADFAELAAQYGTDGTAQQGGDLGWFKEGVMVEPFWEAASNMEIDEISDPVQTDFGWHIIKVTDIQEPRDIADLTDEEKAELKAELVQQMFDDGSTQAVIDEVLADANIQVKDDVFESLFDFSTPDANADNGTDAPADESAE